MNSYKRYQWRRNFQRKEAERGQWQDWLSSLVGFFSSFKKFFLVGFTTVLFGRLFNSFLGYTCKQFPNKHSDGQPLTITEECGIPCVIVPPRGE